MGARTSKFWAHIKGANEQANPELVRLALKLATGAGKTIVALHRAVHLARQNAAGRVLLTTFSKTLANSLKGKLSHLAGNEPGIRGRITVQSLTGVGYDEYSALFGQPNIASTALMQSLLAKAAEATEGHKFSSHFLFGEWSDVVDAWQLRTWEDYRDVSRLGRKTRIGGRQRELLWSIFERVRAGLIERKAVTWSDVFGKLTEHLLGGAQSRFDFVVVDEAQDISVAEARFLAALAKDRPEGLSFTETSASAFSSSRSPGSRWASTCEAALPRCGSITARLTKSALTPTGCSRHRSATWTATLRAVEARSRSPMAPSQRFAPSTIPNRSSRPSAQGSQSGSRPAACRTRLGSSFDPTPS